MLNLKKGMALRKIIMLVLFIMAASLFSSSVTALFLSHCYKRDNFNTIAGIASGIIERQPETEIAVIQVLKLFKDSPVIKEENILIKYGYKQEDFIKPPMEYTSIFTAAGFTMAIILFLLLLYAWNRKENYNIKTLLDALNKANNGGGFSVKDGEGGFFKLQDEIYKTITMLYQAKEEAVKAKNNFAQNLSNIAHQLKTPATSVFLLLQLLKDNPQPCYLEKIKHQVLHLINLSETILLLSRIDTGTLHFNKQKTDIYTILMLASDNLDEFALKADVNIDIPVLGEMLIYADMEWTMEAVINIFKNCIEHTPPGGTVYCLYGQNPVYAYIKIWDNGTGFEKEDLPYVFKKFYRGKNAGNSGAGIGLFLAKSVIEGQNGTITAGNIKDGGACFEIHFYSH